MVLAFHLMRSGVLAFLSVVSLGVVFACSTSTPTDAGALPDGVVPADGGGYCCPVSPIRNIIPCALNNGDLGGWSADPDRCPRGYSVDSYPITFSTDQHGCAVLLVGNCACASRTGTCPALDASVDAHAGDAADAPVPD